MTRKNKIEIAVIGQKIQTKIEEIDIFKLTYWKENPRVNAIINQKYKDKNISDEEIEKELWEKDSVKDLKSDIERHGGLIDEILVKGNTVLEGNSRLCAYRHLYKNAEKKKDENEMLKWSFIRARIIPDDTSDQVVFSILGTWHIKGKAKWDTYEKAAYLKRMKMDYGYSDSDIADSISQTVRFVTDNIEAHDLMVKNDVYTLEKFSYFYEFVKEKNKSINTETYKKDPEIVNRVIETIITDETMKRAEDIRHLPNILKDPKAKKMYLNKEVDFHDAYDISKSRHPEQEDIFYKQIKKTTKLLQECSVKRIEEINSDPNKIYILKCLYKEANSIGKKIGIKN
jgi:hypothetical protein